MAEMNLAQEGVTNRFKQAVCIETGKIFDSCSDKDCLEDLQVFFTPKCQAVIDASTLLKCKSAEVMDVYLNVDPLPFNKGFYAVDITFYFRVSFAAYASPVSPPVDVSGLAYHCKKVILYGSEGCVKTFNSNRRRPRKMTNNLPTATLKAVDPITLGCQIVEHPPCGTDPLGEIPGEICSCFDGELVPFSNGGKVALVTLGLFTIVTLSRDVQMMVPSYDYCVPERDCMTSIPSEDPCEMFKRIKFPVEEFFPEDLPGNGSCSESDD